jgi:hypothetical protein
MGQRMKSRTLEEANRIRARVQAARHLQAFEFPAVPESAEAETIVPLALEHLRAWVKTPPKTSAIPSRSRSCSDRRPGHVRSGFQLSKHQRPNQRARRLAPKSCFSAPSSADGSWNVPVGFGPEKKSTSTRPTRPAPNST